MQRTGSRINGTGNRTRRAAPLGRFHIPFRLLTGAMEMRIAAHSHWHER
jgi:hypothetical protein